MSGYDGGAARAAVRRMAEAGRLSHAYLITGPDSGDRQALARALAQALVCTGENPPCGVCPHCKKAAAGIHPDVTALSFEEGKQEFLVDQIRALRADAYILPNEAARKVYLIDPAGAMNERAQNAFLKVLEEGPAYAAFLLLARTAGEVLPTVASRCEEISLVPAPREEEPGISEDARTLAGLLLAGDESALQSHCVALERSKQDLEPLLEETLLELRRLCRADLNRAARILPKIELIQTLLAALPFHVGAGHLLGWLCAGSR